MTERFDIYQLSHFLTLAKAGNFTRAASLVGITQPALSRSIQKLEDLVGQPLFERQPRGVRLTEAGQFLRERANQIVSLADDTMAEIHELSDRGQVKLGVIPTIAPYLLPELLKDFMGKHPEVKIHVQEDTTQNIIQMCKESEIDVALVALPINERYLTVEPLFEDELVLVLPKGHPLEKKKEIQFSDIHELPFISLDKRHCLSDNIAEYCQRKSVTPLTVERTNQLATIQELVALEHGVSILPRMAQERDRNSARVYKRFASKKPVRTISLLYNPSRHERRCVRMFNDYLRKQAKSSLQ